ncbi:MAG: hypothetical protein KKE65_08685, partial [Actinobacteria bacterium]|nr:hypothetical protein [Actinomycetota bacterium]
EGLDPAEHGLKPIEQEIYLGFIFVRFAPGLPGVAEVHDLHAWTLTSGMNVATAHLVVENGAATQTVLSGAQAVLRQVHGIEHATLQVEVDPARECHQATW